MRVNWKKLARKIHYWGAIIIALPVIVVIGSGIVLLLKKDIDWIQPPTASGQGKIPTLSMAEILDAASMAPGSTINTWGDIARIDIRPAKGVIKIRAADNWEIQLDHQSAEVLNMAYRRSDIIESIHDGTFFHDKVKLGIFLPAAMILLILWLTGLYLFFLPYLARNKKLKLAQMRGESRLSDSG